MHVAFLITWVCPPAAGEAHLATEGNVHAKSNGGREGRALMRGISGTCLMVTFLPGARGALGERRALAAGPAPATQPSHPHITGHGAAQQAALAGGGGGEVGGQLKL